MNSEGEIVARVWDELCADTAPQAIIRPARRIIIMFGGLTKLARALGLATSTVQGWQERGFIPARRQSEVMLAAQRLGLPLTPADFFL